MHSLIKQLKGEIYSLRKGYETSCTLKRYGYVEDEWALLESVSLTPASSQLRTVAFDAVHDTRTSSKSLFLVLRDVSTLQIYEAATNPLRFLRVGLCPAQKDATSYTLLNGPRVAWISDETLNIYSCDGSKAHKTHNAAGLQLERILQALSVRSAILLVARERSSVVFLLLRCNDELCTLRKEHFLPIQYVSLVEAIQVNVSQAGEKVGSALKQNTTCICTSSKQFVVIVRGVVRHSCVIPFNDVLIMQSYSSMLVLGTENQGVCAVQRVDGKLKVWQTWREARAMVCGDFAGCGRMCLLLLRNSHFSTSGIISLLGHEKNITQSTHTATVATALQQRLRLAQNSVAHAEDDALQKQRLIDTIHWRIPNDPTLVATFPSANRPATSVPVSQQLQVLFHGKTIQKDFLVLVWTVRCKSKAQNLEAHLTVPGQCCNYITRVSWERDEAGVVVHCKMPTFVTSVLQATATLSWQTDNGCRQWESFDISIDLDSILNVKALVPKGKLEVECLRLAQKQLSLQIRTQHPRNVLSVLSSSPLEIIQFCNRKLYTCVDERSPLFGLNFHVEKSDLEVLFRDQSQLMLFVHWLYDEMPEDFALLPSLQSEQDVVCKNLMEEEMQLAREWDRVSPTEYCHFRLQLLRKGLETDRALCHYFAQ